MIFSITLYSLLCHVLHTFFPLVTRYIASKVEIFKCKKLVSTLTCTLATQPLLEIRLIFREVLAAISRRNLFPSSNIVIERFVPVHDFVTSVQVHVVGKHRLLG